MVCVHVDTLDSWHYLNVLYTKVQWFSTSLYRVHQWAT